MAEDKKSFILYADQQELFKELSDEEAGKLIKHVFSYVNDENPKPPNKLIQLAFIPIKQHLKRDLVKFEAKRQQRSEAGKRSAELRRLQREAAISTTVESRSTNPTVNDNDNDNDNVNVNDNDINKSLLSELKSSDKEKSKYILTAQMFQKLFIRNLESLGINPIKITRAKAGSWVTPIRLMVEKDKRTKEEFREVYDFLEGDAFWKGNILSTDKLRKQFEKLLIKARYKPENKKSNQIPDNDNDFN